MTYMEEEKAEVKNRVNLKEETNGRDQMTNMLSPISSTNPWAMGRGVMECINMIPSLPISIFSRKPIPVSLCTPQQSPSSITIMGGLCSLPHVHAAGFSPEKGPPHFKKMEKISLSRVVPKQKKKNYWFLKGLQ